MSRGKFNSTASAWEIAIKCARGRLSLPESPDQYVAERMIMHRIQPLPVEVGYALQVFNLPEIHMDPFDRLLFTQSQLEDIPLITADSSIAQYEVEVIW